MAHAEKCPVCEGKGKVKGDKYDTAEFIPCPGCNGRCWVEVSGPAPERVSVKLSEPDSEEKKRLLLELFKDRKESTPPALPKEYPSYPWPTYPYYQEPYTPKPFTWPVITCGSGNAGSSISTGYGYEVALR